MRPSWASMAARRSVPTAWNVTASGEMSLVTVVECEAGDSHRHFPLSRSVPPPARGLDLLLSFRRHRSLFRDLCPRAGQVDLHPLLRVELGDVQRVGVDDDVVAQAGGEDGELAVLLF